MAGDPKRAEAIATMKELLNKRQAEAEKIARRQDEQGGESEETQPQIRAENLEP